MSRENSILILGILVIGVVSFYVSPWWLLAIIAMPLLYVALRRATQRRKDAGTGSGQ